MGCVSSVPVEDAFASYQSPSGRGSSGFRQTYKLVLASFFGRPAINQYLVIKEVGQGAHGAVQVCIDTTTCQLCAMKVVNKRRQRRRSAMSRMGRRRSNAITDPNAINAFHAAQQQASNHPAAAGHAPNGTGASNAHPSGAQLDPRAHSYAGAHPGTPHGHTGGGSFIATGTWSEFDAELMHEIEIMRQLDHPNIVQIKEMVQVWRLARVQRMAGFCVLA